LLLLVFCLSPVSAQLAYQQPSQAAVDILDTPPAPAVSVSPDGKWMVIVSLKGMPGIADRAVPMLGLGGVRVFTRTNGPYDIKPYDMRSSYTGTGTSYRLIRLDDGNERTLVVPDSRLGPPMWSPDSRHFAFLHTTSSGIELWLTEARNGKTRALTGPEINAARSIDRYSDAPCSWMGDSRQLLCHFVPADRGAAPTEGVPVGPSAQQTDGEASPVWTFTNLLTSPLDEQQYDHFMTSEPQLVDIRNGERTAVAPQGIYETLQPSSDGRHLLSVRIVRPYSYLVPANRFPKTVELLDANGKLVRKLADLAMNSAGPTHLGWTADGPRDFVWVPGRSAAVAYVEPLDNGNPKQDTVFRDRVVMLPEPFDGEPQELIRTRSRIVNSDDYRSPNGLKFWADGARALVTEFEWGSRNAQTWLVDFDQPSASPSLVFEHNKDDWYGHPGVPVLAHGDSGEEVLLEDGDWIYLIGEGGSADGDHPFLDRFNIRTRKSERLFRDLGQSYEAIISVLDNRASTIVTRQESKSSPPNVYLRDLDADRKRALTSFSKPEQALSQARKQRINYERKDGIPLSGNLYLPADHEDGERLPVIIWAYPLEYSSKQGAGQVRGSSYRFSGTSPRVTTDYMLFLTQGYAVLADAGMPIVGGLEANDTYVEQLVDNAQAAVDKLVDMGVADRDRVGIAGLSYGAFMTANLLAHSDIFAAGIAMNGAYNRTLTPFGFQAERRTFWEAPEIYFEMSTFMHADKVNEPILLLHGEIDSNSGTYPIQSQRLYHALKGLGASARLVMMPHEDHIYAARETRLHALAEMFDWFDKHVKKAE